MNELNKKLAEALGIEPKYQFTYLIGDEPFVFIGFNKDADRFINTMFERSPINGKKFTIPEQEQLEIYPDFTKPSNFVKLLEVAYKNNCFDGKSATPKTTFINDFLNEMHYSLKNNTEHYLVAEIKHQAQQTEWEY